MELRDPGQMNQRLSLEPPFLTPERHLPVSTGCVAALGTPRIILGQGRALSLIVLELGRHGFRPLPAAAEGDQAQQAACRRMFGVLEHRDGQMLEPLGFQTLSLTPKRELDVGIRIGARIRKGGFVGHKGFYIVA